MQREVVHYTSGTSTKVICYSKFSWSCYTGFVCKMPFIFSNNDFEDWMQVHNCTSNQTKKLLELGALLLPYFIRNHLKTLQLIFKVSLVYYDGANMWIYVSFCTNIITNQIIWNMQKWCVRKHQVPVDLKCVSKDTKTYSSFTESAIKNQNEQRQDPQHSSQCTQPRAGMW